MSSGTKQFHENMLRTLFEQMAKMSTEMQYGVRIIDI